MQYTVLLALLSAAAVVSAENTVTVTASVEGSYPSKTYGGASLPPHQHYSCDATAPKCYEPGSYGKGYDPKSYTYHYNKKYAYPGPGKRFCKWLKGIGHAIGHWVGRIVGKFKRGWKHFKAHWVKWCAIAKSDWERFKDWKHCEVEEWKRWWEYHHDLCKTKKAYWDDAMREFHRCWTHYKEVKKAAYEKKKKDCKITEEDYDNTPEYKKNLDYIGATPPEDSYKSYSTGGNGGTYSATNYQKNCADEKLESDDLTPNIGFSVEIKV
jgi:hypothetical protein